MHYFVLELTSISKEKIIFIVVEVIKNNNENMSFDDFFHH